jgi:hypothetical protein
MENPAESGDIDLITGPPTKRPEAVPFPTKSFHRGVAGGGPIFTF